MGGQVGKQLADTTSSAAKEGVNKSKEEASQKMAGKSPEEVDGVYCSERSVLHAFQYHFMMHQFLYISSRFGSRKCQIRHQGCRRFYARCWSRITRRYHRRLRRKKPV